MREPFGKPLGPLEEQKKGRRKAMMTSDLLMRRAGRALLGFLFSLVAVRGPLVSEIGGLSASTRLVSTPAAGAATGRIKSLRLVSMPRTRRNINYNTFSMMILLFKTATYIRKATFFLPTVRAEGSLTGKIMPHVESTPPRMSLQGTRILGFLLFSDYRVYPCIWRSTVQNLYLSDP